MIKNNFYRELVRIHRSYGQYRRFFEGAPSFEELTGYKVPKRITEASIRHLIKVEKQWRGKWEKAYRDAKKEGELVILGFQRMILAGVAHVHPDWKHSGFWSRMMEESTARLAAAVDDMLDTAIKQHGVMKVAEGLKRFIAKQGPKIEHYAYAIIDTETGGFNTNEQWNKASPKGIEGRNRFVDFSKELCEACGVPEFYHKLLTEAGVREG